MISIEYALDKYTDLINEKKYVDFEYFKKQLNPQDYKEFMEEIIYVNKINSYGITQSFNKLFDKIDKYKNELYDVDTIVNFRARNANNETVKNIEEIFNEEFKDE